MLETPLLRETRKQIQEYLKGIRKNIDFPIKIKGNSKIYDEIRKIPYGRVYSIDDFVKKHNFSKKEVENFIRENPLLIIIPTHRIIIGDLTFFQKKLIELENACQNKDIMV